MVGVPLDPDSHPRRRWRARQCRRGAPSCPVASAVGRNQDSKSFWAQSDRRVDTSRRQKSPRDRCVLSSVNAEPKDCPRVPSGNLEMARKIPIALRLEGLCQGVVVSVNLPMVGFPPANYPYWSPSRQLELIVHRQDASALLADDAAGAKQGGSEASELCPVQFRSGRTITNWGHALVLDPIVSPGWCGRFRNFSSSGRSGFASTTSRTGGDIFSTAAPANGENRSGIRVNGSASAHQAILAST